MQNLKKSIFTFSTLLQRPLSADRDITLLTPPDFTQLISVDPVSPLQRYGDPVLPHLTSVDPVSRVSAAALW